MMHEQVWPPTTFFYPVEYNVFGNSMSPKITYKFKNGVWKKHFKVYDYLGSLRFTLGADKALLNYKQYEPYGETMLDTTILKNPGNSVSPNFEGAIK